MCDILLGADSEETKSPEEIAREKYDLEKNPEALLPIPFSTMDDFIKEYIGYWAKHGEYRKISEATDVIDLTPYYEKLEKTVVSSFGEFPLKRDIWLEKINRFRTTIRLPKIPMPPIPVVSGI